MKFVRALLGGAVALSVTVACSDDGTSSSSSSSSSSSGDPPVDDGLLRLTFEPLTHDLPFPFVTDMEFALDPADEFFVTDLTGGFAHLRLNGDEATATTVGTIDDVYIDGAAGLVGVAVDPEFAINRYFYLVMSISKTTNELRRYTLVEGDAAATLASMVTILELTAPGAPRWHNITTIGFEPDGSTMWALAGDKGLFEPAQDPTSILGSILRINPSREDGVGGYTIPEDAEPFSVGADPAVYAKGLRSPWKGVLHEGRYYYGEVGLDNFEELNVVDGPSLNMGWPLVEGPCALDILGMAPPDCTDQFVDPWLYYDRSNSHPFVNEDFDANPLSKRSIYVGWIYQPRENDPYEGRWNDVVVFGDTYVGFVRAARIDEMTEPSWHVGHLNWATAWAQGPDGYVYAMALDDFPIEDVTDPKPSPLLRAILEKTTD